jgi:hypothetical protein
MKVLNEKKTERQKDRNKAKQKGRKAKIPIERKAEKQKDKYKNNLLCFQIWTQVRRFLSLFVIMGIPWIGELVHAYFHRDHNKMTDCDLTFEVG